MNCKYCKELLKDKNGDIIYVCTLKGSQKYGMPIKPEECEKECAEVFTKSNIDENQGT